MRSERSERERTENMNVTMNVNRNSKIAVINSSDILINNTQDALDLMATIRYLYDCSKIVINKSAITEIFFDLKTGVAGEILQKFTNYDVTIAIVGDFGVYSSKSLKDFIYESNKGKQVFFLSTQEAAINRPSQHFLRRCQL